MRSAMTGEFVGRVSRVLLVALGPVAVGGGLAAGWRGAAPRPVRCPRARARDRARASPGARGRSVRPPTRPHRARASRDTSRMLQNSPAAQKGPVARRRPKVAREAYSLYVERATEG